MMHASVVLLHNPQTDRQDKSFAYWDAQLQMQHPLKLLQPAHAEIIRVHFLGHSAQVTRDQRQGADLQAIRIEQLNLQLRGGS